MRLFAATSEKLPTHHERPPTPPTSPRVLGFKQRRWIFILVAIVVVVYVGGFGRSRSSEYQHHLCASSKWGISVVCLLARRAVTVLVICCGDCSLREVDTCCASLGLRQSSYVG